MIESPASSAKDSKIVHWLLKRGIEPIEIKAVIWAWLYFFCVLSAYYIIRPIRDEMGIAGGTKNLPWLFSGTLISMLLLNIPFAALTKKLPRLKLISVTYRFFMANLLFFAGLIFMSGAEHQVWIGRAFFIWTSVFNLFVVAIFWILMVDVFSSAQGKRLFGFIAAGGTTGAVLGSAITASLSKHVPSVYLMLGSIFFLEIALLCVRRLGTLSSQIQMGATKEESESPIGGSVFSGITHTFRSSYLMNIMIYVFLSTITATTLYFMQAHIVEAAFSAKTDRVAFLARIDLFVNLLTLFFQLFVTARLLKYVGVGLTLTLLPFVTVTGFTLLAFFPTATMLLVVQVLRRAGSYALAKPAFEVLFTVVSREDKYRAKSFMDTVVYRAGDQIGAWSQSVMVVIGVGAYAFPVVAVSASLLWLLNGVYLGIKQRRMTSD